MVNPVSAQDKLLLAQRLFSAAVSAVIPATTIPRHLPPADGRRLIVLGAGKAAVAMARAVTDNWSGPLTGTVVTRHGYGGQVPGIDVIEAGHPLPDQGSIDGAQTLMRIATQATAQDTVLMLISGGGSALVAYPADGLGLEEKQGVTRALLACGASIHEINTVRKHLSRIKGGRLARAAYPAKLISLAISDVPGDDPSVIASGPTVPDPSTYTDARAILARYGVALSPVVRACLERAADESPKDGNPVFAQAEYHLVARPRDALDAAASVATGAGYRVLDLGDRVEGEAQTVARAHAEMIQQTLARKERVAILSGGETTVTIAPGSSGRGGRNREYLLTLGMLLNGHPDIVAVAGGTDGADGMPRADGIDVAGAVIGPDFSQALRDAGIDPAAALAQHDSGTVFTRLGTEIITGGTDTNVSDFRAILIG